MQQVKIFSGLEGHTGELEQQINDWLASSGARVLQITGNVAPQSLLGAPDNKSLSKTGGGSRRFAPSDVLVIVLYETD